MFLNILLGIIVLGIVVIFLATRKDSVVLKFLIENSASSYAVYHVVLSFYAVFFGSFGNTIRKKSFGNVLDALLNAKGYTAGKHKAQLFADLKDEKRRLRVLEVGAGTGSNFVYYPKECDLIVVEPNSVFQELVENKLKEYEGIRLMNYYQIKGESLSPIKSDSVDVVLTTLIHCSVTDIPKVMSEIRRVLKPGGKYYFMDHILDRPFTFRWFVQSFLIKTHLWQFWMLGCTFRDIRFQVRKAGFSSVEDHVTSLVVDNVSLVKLLIDPHYIGIATK